MTKWKLVPVEPTPEMIWKAEEDSPEFNHGDPWYGSEPPSEGQIRAIYTAMLEAAPQPPKSEPVAYIEHHKGGDNLVWDNPGGEYSALYTAPPAPSVPDNVARDAARLDWLVERNAPHGLGWEIIQMPAGNVHIHTLFGDKAKFGSIRDAIDAAIERQGGES